MPNILVEKNINRNGIAFWFGAAEVHGYTVWSRSQVDGRNISFLVQYYHVANGKGQNEIKEADPLKPFPFVCSANKTVPDPINGWINPLDFSKVIPLENMKATYKVIERSQHVEDQDQVKNKPLILKCQIVLSGGF